MEDYKRSIYVSQLPKFYNRSALESYFREFGRIESGLYEGFGVKYCFEDFKALIAIFEHGYHVVERQILCIGFPSLSHQIFVTYIPLGTTKQHLIEYFSSYGKINPINRAWPQPGCKTLYISYEKEESVKAALEANKFNEDNSFKVTTAFRLLKLDEPVENPETGKMILVEILPQVVSDHQVKKYFEKFDGIEAFSRKEYICKVTFVSAEGPKRVLNIPEHRINRYKVYARALDSQQSHLDSKWKQNIKYSNPYGNQGENYRDQKPQEQGDMQHAAKKSESMEPMSSKDEASEQNDEKETIKTSMPFQKKEFSRNYTSRTKPVPLRYF